MKCKYCEYGPGNLHLNHATRNKTDISIKLTNGGVVLHCTHYDIEGDTNDAQDAVLINYCPMCGRALLENAFAIGKKEKEK